MPIHDLVQNVLEGEHPMEELLQSQRDGYQALLDSGLIPADLPEEGAYIGSESSQYRLFIAGERAGQQFLEGELAAIRGVIAEYDIELGKSLLDLIDEGAREKLDEIQGAIGDASLAFLRGAGRALVDGAEDAYDYIREKLSGREPEVIAGFTIAALVIIAVMTMRHEVTTGPGGAGEYAAGNRPSPSPSYPLE